MLDGPGVRPGRARRARRRSDATARRRAARRADRRQRPRARRGRQADAQHARRDLAGERRRPLPATRSTSIPAPLDPNFSGAGRSLTDDDGHYRFVTIKPGSYPWGNHENAWRPAHIHFSVFGHAFTQRLVTQMYFPGDPLFAYDPIFHSVRDPKSRELLISQFDLTRRARLGARLPAGTSSSAAAATARRRSRSHCPSEDPVADRRARTTRSASAA